MGLAAVDGLAEHVTLRSGRLPRRCTAERCEVLRLRGTGSLPNAPGLRLVQVGTATLDSRQLFGDFLEPTDNATADAEIAPALRESGRYHRPAAPPLVVAEGVDALAASPAIARTYRSYAWVWPLAPGHPRLWEVDDLIGRVERARAELLHRLELVLREPPGGGASVRRAARHGQLAPAAARRGRGGALLLAFALLAARGMRRDLDAARLRLTWSGRPAPVAARPAHRRRSRDRAVGGVVVGWAVGTAAGAVAARLAGAPAGAVLVRSVVSPRGLAIAAGLVLVTTALVVAAVSLRSRERGRIGAPELVGAAALLVIGVALLGGALDEDRLATAEGLPLLLVLPGLVVLVAAVVVARVVPWLGRVVADRGRAPLSVRLAAVGLGRGPGTTVVTVGFLTIAFGLALLAEGYRATLARGESEQAAFQVPLDVAVQEDLLSLVRPLDAAPIERYRALAGPGGDAHPVLRVTGGAGRAEQVTGVTVLGLDRGAIERVGVWRRAGPEATGARTSHSSSIPGAW